MKQLEILGLAGLVFTAVKFSFVIAQWIFEKDGDKILRRNLDTIWDELNRLTFRQVAMRLLVRIVEKMRALLQAPRNPRGKLFLAFFILNIVAYVIAQSLFCALENECGRTLGHDEVLSEYGAGRLTLWLCLSFLGSTLLQLSGLYLVHKLLATAALQFGLPKLVLLLAVSTALLVAVFFAQYAVQQVSTYLAFGLGPYWDRMFGNILEGRPYFWATLVLSLFAGFPLVVFLLVLATSTILRTLPNAARAATIWIVWKITTDSTPVLERLGYVAGGVASLSSAIASYIKA